MKRVAIVQSNYIPWKGYFDLIGMVDEFIFHDDLQYTKQDWRNRNKIKTPNGSLWLTIPCGSNEKRLINEVELNDKRWQKKHWSIIKQNYQKSVFFKEYQVFFEDIYLNKEWDYLSEFNQYVIKKISREILCLKTEFTNSVQYKPNYTKQERVIDICLKSKTNIYLSGISAKNYINEDIFIKNNIQIEWMDYSNYPEYRQLYPPFEHGVTILDLIFNEGPNAIKFMKSFKRE